MLIVTNEDVHDGTREVNLVPRDFSPPPSQGSICRSLQARHCLQFNWQSTETVNLECYTTTSIPAVSMAERESFADGIRMRERQVEELIPNTGVSGGDNNESDSDEDATEQITRCNLPGRSRRSRMVKPPARL